MTEDEIFAAELAKAEEDLLKAEETHGKDHVKVSHCLDSVAALLRSKKMRTLDAANMEARARAIRVKQHQGDKSTETAQMREIAETIKNTSARLKRERRNKKIQQVAVACLFFGVVAQTVFFPLPQEKKLADSIATAVKNFKPNEVGKGLMDKSTASAKAAAAKQQEHNNEIDQYINN